MKRKEAPTTLPCRVKAFRYREDITSDPKLAQEWLKNAQKDAQEPVVAYISKTEENHTTTALQLELNGLEYDIFKGGIITLTGNQIYPEAGKGPITIDVNASHFVDANIYSFYVDGIYYDYAYNNSSGCLHDHVVDKEFIDEKIANDCVVYGTGGYVQTDRIVSMITSYAFQTVSGQVYRIRN